MTLEKVCLIETASNIIQDKWTCSMFSSSVVYIGHQRQMPCSDCVAWYYGLGMAFFAIAAPSLPCLLGITALFARYSIIFLSNFFSFVHHINM